MKFLYLFFCLVNSNKIIKNLDIPSCRNCKYFKPSIYNNDFTSSISKCEKFGNKDIINNKITYDYVDECRNNELKCGINGKYYEEEKNIDLKILKFNIISNLPYLLLVISVILSTILQIIYIKK